MSVIIPVYNAERWLAEALESVRSQTFGDFEAILVDDASTDRSPEIAQDLSATDQRFRLIRRNVNGGAAAAQNTGVRAASGEWIALLGCDDVWMPEKLEKQVALINANPDASLVFSNGVEFDETGEVGLFYRERRKFPEGNVLERLLARNCFWASSVMVRRRDLLEIGLFCEDVAIGEDYLAWALILARGGRAVGVWEPLVRYRKTKTSLSNRRERAYRDLEIVHEKLLEATRDQRYRAVLARALARDRSDQHMCAARAALKKSRLTACSELLQAWLRLPTRIRPLGWIPLLATPAGAGVVERRLARRW
ncbi:MAG: glycosyltransferase family 2 protein [Armatimonadota bacterium]